MQKKSSFIVFVLYDSIDNSVFEGQILQPLLNQKKTSKILLISFEKKKPNIDQLKIIKNYKNIEIIILKKNLFFGQISLIPSIKRLHTLLKKLPEYILYARGPHAGWISLHASNNTQCTNITIQARGILPEEYAFVHKNKKIPFSWIHTLRKKHFETLEKVTYSYKSLSIPLTIESVSDALKTYLIEKYAVEPTKISIAKKDIPQTISIEQKTEWRTQIRHKLGIPNHANVFCYNGSIKPWQCPEETIDYFIEQQKKNNSNFLLILTQNKKLFQHLLKQKQVDPAYYYVCTVAHKEIYKYLAACDSGLLFRKPTILNWVSRPTKFLEYQAARLSVIHNNTIKVVIQQKPTFTTITLQS